LAMAPAGACQNPTVFLKHNNNIADFHWDPLLLLYILVQIFLCPTFELSGGALCAPSA
jgi:hypothetical protein